MTQDYNSSKSELERFFFPKDNRVQVLKFLYRNQDEEVRPVTLQNRLDISENYMHGAKSDFRDLGLLDSKKGEHGQRLFELTEKGVRVAEALERFTRSLEEVSRDE